MSQGNNNIEYVSLNFSKDLERGKAFNPDDQSSALKPLDDICNEFGGLHLETIDRGLGRLLFSTRYLVGGIYIENFFNDSPESSPRTNSVITNIKYARGNENEALFKRIMAFYGYDRLPTPWETSRPVN